LEDWSGDLGQFDCQVRKLTNQQFSSISNTHTPQGIIAVVKLPADTYSSDLPPEPGSRILLLENIQDPGNTGTLLRTAAALGFSGALLSTQTADPFSPKAVQATAGSVLSLWIRRNAGYLQMAASLKKMGYEIMAADVGGSSHVEFSCNSKLVIALGSEGCGLTQEMVQIAGCRFRIPITDKVESLNVAVSGAIAMFCAQRGIGW